MKPKECMGEQWSSLSGRDFSGARLQMLNAYRKGWGVRPLVSWADAKKTILAEYRSWCRRKERATAQEPRFNRDYPGSRRGSSTDAESAASAAALADEVAD